MKSRFEIEWQGGSADHYFHGIRPAVQDLPWGTLDSSQYPPLAVEFARVAWTDVAINEYRAASAFTEVLRALLDVKAPLDVIGMASDFLADECSHVEMASRVAMELGGAVERIVDPEHFVGRPHGLTAMQRANELVLRVSCVDEAFTAGTTAVNLQTTSHPLVRAVYEAILRDEAHHRRLGALYFEWALGRIDDVERQRLGRVLFSQLNGISFYWKPSERAAKAVLPTDAIRALGWLEPLRFAAVSREVLVRDILDPLASIGIAVTDGERAGLLSASGA